METRVVIGCDIGGVVRRGDDPVPGAIEGLKSLLRTHDLLFISKAGQEHRKKTLAFLKEYELDTIPIIFCDTDKEKAGIAAKNRVKVMIDDKHSILNQFPKDNLKIWLCDDQKQIDGAIKYNHLEFVKLARNRDEVIKITIPPPVDEAAAEESDDDEVENDDP